MRALNLFFSLHGRIGRAGFWLGLFGIALVGTALAAYLLSEIFGQNIMILQPQALAKPALQLMALLSLLLLYPLLAVVCKRLHDRGRGIWGAIPILLAAMIPAATVLTGLYQRVGAALTGAATPIELIGVVCYGILILIILIDLGFFPGQNGVNRYGPDPRQP